MAKDLAAARQAWIEEAADPAERQRREESDYLTYRDAEGRTFDFHATRHSFITLLVRSGVQPKLVQELARHSSSALTDRYTHIRLHDQAAALEAMPSLLPDGDRPQGRRLAATGTDPVCCTNVAQTLEGGRGQLIVDGGERKRTDPSEEATEPLKLPAVEGSCERMIADDERVGDGTRTRDFQSHSLIHVFPCVSVNVHKRLFQQCLWTFCFPRPSHVFHHFPGRQSHHCPTI
jgi:hypothetical protein